MSPSVYLPGVQAGDHEDLLSSGFSGGVGFGSSVEDLSGGISGVDPGCSSFGRHNQDSESVVDSLVGSSSELCICNGILLALLWRLRIRIHLNLPRCFCLRRFLGVHQVLLVLLFLLWLGLSMLRRYFFLLMRGYLVELRCLVMLLWCFPLSHIGILLQLMLLQVRPCL